MKKYGLPPGIQEHGIGQMVLGRLTWMGFIRALLPPGILSMASPRSIQLPPTLTGSRSSPGIPHNSSSLMLQVWHCFVLCMAVVHVAMLCLCYALIAAVMSQLVPVTYDVAQLHKQGGRLLGKPAL